MRNRARPDTPLPGLDDRSRRQIGLLARQVVLVAVICLPVTLDGGSPLRDYLSLLRAVFGFSALAVTGAAMLTRAPLSDTSLCIWDHGMALLLLKFVCALSLEWLA
jgi:hypothetical protein